MKNSSGLEESKGCVLFAYNTREIDYVSIADANAKLITKNLNLPVTLITDLSTEPKFKYDKIIRVENTLDNFRTFGQTKQTWRNGGRSQAYDLSPYDLTLILDSDYLILDQSLTKLFDQWFDYRLQYNSYSDSGLLYNNMGTNYSLPFVWATCVLFRKSIKTKLYFDLIKKIERNYAYYKTLFQARGTFRNDYVFAMADIILNGYKVNQSKGNPLKMFTIEQDIESIYIKDKFMIIKHNDRAVVSPTQNVHIMDKKYLQSDHFQQLIQGLCNDLA